MHILLRGAVASSTKATYFFGNGAVSERKRSSRKAQAASVPLAERTLIRMLLLVAGVGLLLWVTWDSADPEPAPTGEPPPAHPADIPQS